MLTEYSLPIPFWSIDQNLLEDLRCLFVGSSMFLWQWNSLNFYAEGRVILIQCTNNMAETAQLRAAIKEYEDLIRDYKEQVGQIEIKIAEF